MKLEHWVHPEIELYEIKVKKSNVMLTFRLFGNKEKYFFILSGDGLKGFDIKCLGNFNKQTSYITLFTYHFIQNALKDFLYGEYPGLTISETFSDKAAINGTLDIYLKENKNNIRNYIEHFSQLVFITILLSCFVSTILFSTFDRSTSFYIPVLIGLFSYFSTKTDYFKRLATELVIFRKYSNN